MIIIVTLIFMKESSLEILVTKHFLTSWLCSQSINKILVQRHKIIGRYHTRGELSI